MLLNGQKNIKDLEPLLNPGCPERLKHGLKLLPVMTMLGLTDKMGAMPAITMYFFKKIFNGKLQVNLS